MMQKQLPMVLGFVAMSVVACAPHAVAPAGVPVHPLVADQLTLRGTAAPTLASATCTAQAPANPSNVLELSEDTRASIFLGPVPGDPPLPIAMLHITNLDTNRTWCVMTKADGTPAALAADLPSGLYAISVAETSGAPPRRYEVKLEKL